MRILRPLLAQNVAAQFTKGVMVVVATAQSLVNNGLTASVEQWKFYRALRSHVSVTQPILEGDDKPLEETAKVLSVEALVTLTKFFQRESQRAARARQKAKRQKAEANLSVVEWVSILHAYNFKCAYCGSAYQSLDHIVPLRNGGTSTARNCIPACFDCNNRKDVYATVPKRRG